MTDAGISIPIAYFDMNKNAEEFKRNLENDKDYHEAASACFDCSDSFLRFASYPFLFGRVEDAFSTAAFTNASFSCELFLKTILLAQCEKPGNIHKLDDLFEKLSYDIQESIISSFPMGEGTHTRDRDDFMLQLHEIRDAFPIIRYCYEMTSYSFHYEFVLNLALSLREEARSQLSAIGYEKSEAIIPAQTRNQSDKSRDHHDS